jgi:hypothetical protein
MKLVGQRIALMVGAFACSAGFLAVGSGSSVAASGVPYNDPNAVGSIGLCDQDGQTLTHGSVNTKPFIWKAVDATAAIPPYNTADAGAILYAYQPRQGVDPRQWGGAQMSAASRFTDPAHPTAAMTGLDESLAGLLGAYSPQWDGFIQLRVYLSAPNQPVYSQTYDATNIKVQGGNWSVVGGSSVSCGAGSAVSHEQILATSSAVAASLAAQTTQTPSKPTASGGGKATTPGGPTAAVATDAAGQPIPASSGASDSSGASAPSAPDSPSASDQATGNTKGGSAPTTLIWILVVVGLLGAGFVGVQWQRSRAS